MELVGAGRGAGTGMAGSAAGSRGSGRAVGSGVAGRASLSGSWWSATNKPSRYRLRGRASDSAASSPSTPSPASCRPDIARGCTRGVGCVLVTALAVGQLSTCPHFDMWL